MILVFELSMPNRGSWNGGWSAERDYFAIVKSFRGKKAEARAAEILAKGSYYYGWSDGWGASVAVRQVNRNESVAARRKSKGFCGYDWMVRTICDYGKIMDDAQVKEHHARKRADLDKLRAIASNHSSDPLLANIEQGVRDGLAASAANNAT